MGIVLYLRTWKLTMNHISFCFQKCQSFICYRPNTLLENWSVKICNAKRHLSLIRNKRETVSWPQTEFLTCSSGQTLAVFTLALSVLFHSSIYFKTSLSFLTYLHVCKPKAIVILLSALQCHFSLSRGEKSTLPESLIRL